MRGGSALDVVFSQRVARFIRYDSATRKYDELRVKALVEQFDILIKNIKSWATGNDCAPLMKKKEIEEFIDAHKE